MNNLKTVYLLETHGMDGNYNKVNVNHIGLFKTKEEAKKYAIQNICDSEEFFAWSCSIIELNNIVDFT